MRTKLFVAIGVATIWGCSAQAGQLTFGPSDQNITFTGNGADSVTVSSPMLTGLALDPTNGQVGSFIISPLSFAAGPEASGIFPAGVNTEIFTYVNLDDGDTLTETWQITMVQDDTPQAKFFGTSITTAISGDAAFLATFRPVGTVTLSIGSRIRFPALALPTAPR